MQPFGGLSGPLRLQQRDHGWVNSGTVRRERGDFGSVMSSWSSSPAAMSSPTNYGTRSHC
jgi:hypothetical protein